ncbi:hypothetical protein [Rhizobium sp. No.120]
MTVLQDINEILFTRWDPIGVRHVAPSDEYMNIATEIIELCGEQADARRIAQILAVKRTQDMMMEADNLADTQIAEEVAAVIRAQRVR